MAFVQVVYTSLVNGSRLVGGRRPTGVRIPFERVASKRVRKVGREIVMKEGQKEDKEFQDEEEKRFDRLREKHHQRWRIFEAAFVMVAGLLAKDEAMANGEDYLLDTPILFRRYKIRT